MHFQPSSIRKLLEAPRAVDSIDLSSFNPASDSRSRAELALALFDDPAITTEALIAAAAESLRRRRPDKSTFVPIFTTNYCDSECLMCGMRKGNLKLERRFSSKRVIEEQLTILRDHEGVRGVGFLTGEYEGDYVRKSNAFLIGWAVSRALEMGFQRVYFNIGSMEDDEIAVLTEWFEPEDEVVMCVFQESYDPGSYARFMGDAGGIIPKADYDRRVTTFDRWLDAGHRHVNPGVLVGLHLDLREELVYLASHLEHLLGRGAAVDVSLPRLRPALGSSAKLRIDDDWYKRVIATVALVLPECPIVLTTREDQAFQDEVLPIVGVLSPGSPDVAPYRRAAMLPNEARTSQFLIPDLRRPRDILSRFAGMGYQIRNFVSDGTSSDS